MTTLTFKTGFRWLFVAALIVTVIISATPRAMAGSTDGHIGGKPDIGQGDGIPQTKPGTIRAGEQNKDGDANAGSEPAQDGGDGIPNGGPIEGDEHGGQGKFGGSSFTAFLSQLLFIF